MNARARRLGRRYLRWLESPLGWVILAYFILILVGVRVVEIDRRTARDESIRRQDDAIRLAEVNAAYDSCVRSIPELRQVNLFVNGVQRLHRALYANAVATHHATPRSDPAYKIQLTNLARLAKAKSEVAGVRFEAPTRADCREARDQRLRGPAPTTTTKGER